MKVRKIEYGGEGFYDIEISYKNNPFTITYDSLADAFIEVPDNIKPQILSALLTHISMIVDLMKDDICK